MAILRRLFWQWKLRIKILLAGGRQRFIVRYINEHYGTRMNFRSIDHKSGSIVYRVACLNQEIHVKCHYSKFNGRGCTLPCIACDKFRLERSKVDELKKMVTPKIREAF